MNYLLIALAIVLVVPPVIGLLWLAWRADRADRSRGNVSAGTEASHREGDGPRTACNNLGRGTLPAVEHHAFDRHLAIGGSSGADLFVSSLRVASQENIPVATTVKPTMASSTTERLKQEFGIALRPSVVSLLSDVEKVVGHIQLSRISSRSLASVTYLPSPSIRLACGRVGEEHFAHELLHIHLRIRGFGLGYVSYLRDTSVQSGSQDKHFFQACKILYDLLDHRLMYPLFINKLGFQRLQFSNSSHIDENFLAIMNTAISFVGTEAATDPIIRRPLCTAYASASEPYSTLSHARVLTLAKQAGLEEQAKSFRATYRALPVDTPDNYYSSLQTLLEKLGFQRGRLIIYKSWEEWRNADIPNGPFF